MNLTSTNSVAILGNRTHTGGKASAMPLLMRFLFGCGHWCNWSPLYMFRCVNWRAFA